MKNTLLLALTTLLLVACGGTPESSIPKQPNRINATPEQEAAWQKLSHDPQRIAAGKKIYHSINANCISCHGRDGLGRFRFGPNLRDDYWIYGSSMASIIESVGYGRRKGMMPGLKPRYSDKDIESLAAYLAHWNQTEKANDQGHRYEETERLSPIDY